MCYIYNGQSKQEQILITELISFAKEYLKQEGFEELYYDKMLSPKENGKFFITPFPDVLFAFTTGNAKAKIQSLRMAFAHVDQP